MATVNEYDTFDYLKPADYLPAKEARDREINQGFEDAEVMAKVNDRQRVAEATSFGRAIKNAESFSKSAATYLKNERDKRQKVYAHEAFDLQQELGATQQGLAEFQREREALGQDHSVAAYFAQLALESQEPDKYDGLINLTGWRLQIQEEVLAENWVLSYQDRVYDGETGVTSKNENGDYNYTITVDGVVKNWDTADQTEKSQILKQWELQEGFKGVSHYRKEFADSVFWTKYKSERAAIFEGEKTKAITQKTADTFLFHETSIVSSAQMGGDNFGKRLYDILKYELIPIHKGDEAAARTALKNYVVKLYNDKKITYDQALAFSEYQGIPHRGTDGVTVGLDFWKEFQDLPSELATVNNNHTQIETAEVNGFGDSFVTSVKTGLQEQNEPLTEATLSQVVTEFKRSFRERFGRDPKDTEIPTDLIGMLTVEDDSDFNINAKLEAKKQRNEEITYFDYARIKDQTLFETWSDYSKTDAGKGFIPGILELRNSSIERELALELDVTLSPVGETKNYLYNSWLPVVQAEYDSIYRDVIGTTEGLRTPSEINDIIIARLKARFPDLKLKETSTNATKLKSIVVEGNHYISQNSGKGKTNSEIFGTALIPGSKDEYAKVEEYATGRTVRLPQYYYVLAENIDNLDAWDIANLQFMSQNNGKQLPKPLYKTNEESALPIINYLRKTKPNNKKLLRSKVIEGGNNFNAVSLRPELIDYTQVEEVLQ